jgi:LmbE family N-acetylglucosaminyl deacetylase
MKRKIIVFAPHPDDETFGCGGTIAKRIGEGYDVLVVVMTDGRNAFLKVLGIASDPMPQELKEIRKEEVTRATKILGVPEENLLFLDFEDGTLERNEDEAKRKVIKILRDNVPVEVYFTCEKDVNIDHRVTSRIVTDSIKELGLDTAKYQYSIVRKYARVDPVMDNLLNIFKRNMVHVDVTKFLPLKEAALREFKSEITVISNRQQKPIMEHIEKFLKDKETFFTDS